MATEEKQCAEQQQLPDVITIGSVELHRDGDWYRSSDGTNWGAQDVRQYIERGGEVLRGPLGPLIHG